MLHTVTLTLSDNENGGLQVNWVCEPEVDMNQPVTSQAVYASTKIIELLQELAHKAAQENRDVPLN